MNAWDVRVGYLGTIIYLDFLPLFRFGFAFSAALKSVGAGPFAVGWEVLGCSFFCDSGAGVLVEVRTTVSSSSLSLASSAILTSSTGLFSSSSSRGDYR